MRFSARWVRAATVALGMAMSVGPTVAVGSAGPGGAFFTLGFRGSSQTFVVFAREQKAIRALRADLSKPPRQRRIVSGIVRIGRPYNQPWSYTMGPRSILLGQTFIEVCDASPTYVENHPADWLGRRWCPWSSYVEHAGR